MCVVLCVGFFWDGVAVRTLSARVPLADEGEDIRRRIRSLRRVALLSLSPSVALFHLTLAGQWAGAADLKVSLSFLCG